MRVNFKMLLTGIMLYAAGPSVAQHVARGTVYADVNANGIMDRNEKGLPGVGVSNGTAVVLTDGSGRYQLPVGNDNIVFVIKPQGYAGPVDKNNMPRFFYIHKPQGSPKGLKYAGVSPTGALPKAINFAMRKTSEPEKFKALIFGDPQPYNDQEVEYFNRAIIDEVRGRKDLTFGLCLGDLVGDTLALHPAYTRAVARVGLPWYNVKGNHDMNYDVTADSLNDENFEANFGPATYAFNYGKVHFIVLDDIRYPNPKGGKGYWGGFRKEQLDFVENDLKLVPKDRLVVLAFHIPLFHTNGDAFRPEDRTRLFDILKDRPNTLSLSAHTHFQEQLFYTRADGWQQDKPHHEYNVGTTCGDWWSGQADTRGLPDATMRDGTPLGYAIIHFNNNKYELQWKAAGHNADYQVKLTHPAYVNAGRGSSSAVYANFFMGHKNSVVECAVDGGKWKPMEYVQTEDPAYLALLHPYDNAKAQLTGRRPSDAMMSSHLWKMAMPWKLKEGTHTIQVRARDDYGNTFTAKSSYVIAKPLPMRSSAAGIPAAAAAALHR